MTGTISLTRTQLGLGDCNNNDTEQDDDDDDDSSPKDEDGTVGQGSNWIEKSFPVATSEKLDPKRIEDYNLGIAGQSFQTGPLSGRMYEVIVTSHMKRNPSVVNMDPDIQQALQLAAMV